MEKIRIENSLYSERNIHENMGRFWRVNFRDNEERS